MGRNGAGKSTLLRAAPASSSRPRAASRRPAAARCSPRAPPTTSSASGSATSCPARRARQALEAVGLEWAADADPRDLSGGERQRLALAIAMAGPRRGGELPGLVCLDEPTRGMDRARKDELVAWIGGLAAAAPRCSSRPTTSSSPPTFAERVVLLGDGEVIADGRPPTCSRAAGTSRPRSRGSSGRPARSRPSRAPRVLRRASAVGGAAMSWQARSFVVLGARARRRVRLVRALAALRRGWSPWSPRWPRSPSPAGSCSPRSRTSSRRPTSCCSPATRSAARPASRSARSSALVSNFWLGPGAVDAVADGGLGAGRARRRGAARR